MEQIQSMNVGFAMRYGVPAALVFHDIKTHCENDRSLIRISPDGKMRSWFRISVWDLLERHPYMSESTLMRTLSRLKKERLVYAREFSENPFDRTHGYCPTDRAERIYERLADICSADKDTGKSARKDFCMARDKWLEARKIKRQETDMTLEELRTMKERSDSIVRTLKSDREILSEAADEAARTTEKSFDEFMLRLCEYAKITIDAEDTDVPLDTVGKHIGGGFPVIKANTDGVIQIEFHKPGQTLIISLYKDRWEKSESFHPALGGFSEEKFIEFKNQLLLNAPYIESLVQKVTENYINHVVYTEKRKNDEIARKIELSKSAAGEIA